MKPSVRRALEAMQSVSADSALLVDKLKGDQGVIDTLRKQLAEMREQLAVLRSELASAHDTPLTDEERSDLKEALYNHYRTVETPDLQLYGRLQLLEYDRTTRLVLVTVLNNILVERNEKPREDWLDIIASGGEL